jgi:hypothetical protein
MLYIFFKGGSILETSEKYKKENPNPKPVFFGKERRPPFPLRKNQREQGRPQASLSLFTEAGRPSPLIFFFTSAAGNKG